MANIRSSEHQFPAAKNAVRYEYARPDAPCYCCSESVNGLNKRAMWRRPQWPP